MIAVGQGSVTAIGAALAAAFFTLGIQLIREALQNRHKRRRELQVLLDAAATSLYGVQATLESIRRSIGPDARERKDPAKRPGRGAMRRYEDSLSEARSYLARLSVRVDASPTELSAYRRAIAVLTVEPLEDDDQGSSTWRDDPATELDQRLRQAGTTIDEFHLAIRASHTSRLRRRRARARKPRRRFRRVIRARLKHWARASAAVVLRR